MKGGRLYYAAIPSEQVMDMQQHPGQADTALEFISGLVKLHVGAEPHVAFSSWLTHLSRQRQVEFLRDLGRFDMQTSIPLERVSQPETEVVKRKSEQAYAFSAVALWRTYEVRDLLKRR